VKFIIPLRIKVMLFGRYCAWMLKSPIGSCRKWHYFYRVVAKTRLPEDRTGKQSRLRIFLFMTSPFCVQLLNRRSPFGLDVISAARELPSYFLEIAEVEVRLNGRETPVEVTISIKCGLNVDQTVNPNEKKQKNRFNMTSVLTLTSDMDFVDFRRIQWVLVSCCFFHLFTYTTEQNLSKIPRFLR
jgi:hypothetical protein